MKGVKIAALLLLVGLIALLFCGCAESFTFTEYTDGNGGVHREFLLTYDEKAEDAETVKAQAIVVMQRYAADKGVSEYAEIDDSVEGEVLLELYFPSLTDYYIALGYTGREENAPATPIKKGLINTYERETTSYLNEASIAYVRSLLDEEFKDIPLTCDFYYTYGTTSKTTRSNGKVTEEGGIYYHTWKLSPDEPADIEITVRALNGILLFVIAISIFVLSLVVIFVIMYITWKNEIKKRTCNSAYQAFDGTDDPFSDRN